MVLEKEKVAETVCRIELEGGDVLGALFPWFQSGVWIRLPEEMTIGSLLVDRWGLSEEFIEKTVGTVFLNGVPVDDVQSERLCDGDVLALSGPMPGLAGAILRKNSPLAGLRQCRRTPFHEDFPKTSEMPRVQIKLFNRLIEDLGPLLLRHGILLDHEQALQCLGAWKNSARAKPTMVRVDKEVFSFEVLDALINKKQCSVTLWISS